MSESTRPPLRYRWNHRSVLHRSGVKAFNALVRPLPLALKYRASTLTKADRPPYAMLTPTARAVQIGCPADTVRTGRARGISFSLLTAPAGATLIVEPDPESVRVARDALTDLGLDHVEVVHSAVWDCDGELELLVDPKHPATNIVSDISVYDNAEENRRYQRVVVPSRRLDDIVADTAMAGGPIDLLSITTNGAERQILAGAPELLARTSAVALARTEEDFSDVMSDAGFSFFAHDDRGVTFTRPSGDPNS